MSPEPRKRLWHLFKKPNYRLQNLLDSSLSMTVDRNGELKFFVKPGTVTVDFGVVSSIGWEGDLFVVTVDYR